MSEHKPAIVANECPCGECTRSRRRALDRRIRIRVAHETRILSAAAELLGVSVDELVAFAASARRSAA